MSRVPDPALRLRWQRRLRKFQTFHGSVRRFCDAEGVSVASFYQSRQKLNDNSDATTSDDPTLTVDLAISHSKIAGIHERLGDSQQALIA